MLQKYDNFSISFLNKKKNDCFIYQSAITEAGMT